MTQRSGDWFLGIGFNMITTALGVYILCHITGLKPGKIKMNICDAHLYSNHLEQAREQLTREPMPWPQLEITKPFDREKDDPIEFIESLEYSDFKLIGYKSHKRIKAPMAV